jgi:hypothetical protein
MNEGSAAFSYDEIEIASRLAALPPSARALFACTCAERLMPTYSWFCDLTGSANFKSLREILNAAWHDDIPDPSAKATETIALMPRDEEEGKFLVSAVAQNAVACVAYAIRARQRDEEQASVWAARQLYNSADTVVQQGSAIQRYIENIDLEAPVQLMLRGIYTALNEVAIASREDLFADAQEDGKAFLGYINGDT